jgi:hypothetical protein
MLHNQKNFQIAIEIATVLFNSTLLYSTLLFSTQFYSTIYPIPLTSSKGDALSFGVSRSSFVGISSASTITCTDSSYKASIKVINRLICHTYFWAQKIIRNQKLKLCSDCTYVHFLVIGDKIRNTNVMQI